MKPLIGLVGVLAVMLGLLWLLQGLGVVHLRPVLCFADCATVQGRSAGWAIIGGILATTGAWTILRVSSGRRRQPLP
jgi:hypothetical protein